MAESAKKMVLDQKSLLGQNNFGTFRALMKQADRLPRRAPTALINWVKEPVPDRDLGLKVLDEMSSSTALLGYSRKRKSRWDN